AGLSGSSARLPSGAERVFHTYYMRVGNSGHPILTALDTTHAAAMFHVKHCLETSQNFGEIAGNQLGVAPLPTHTTCRLH
ncbi:MAG: hypothetical protein ACREEV_11565, partial [Dongiaceae bacterium]